MLALLLRRLGLLSALLFLLVLGAAHPALATHLLGGEMTYRYLDANGPALAPLRYEITVTVYNNCANNAIRAAAAVGIYNQDTGTRVILTSINYPYTTSVSAQSGVMSIPQTSISPCIAPVVPPGCTITGVSQPYQLQKFVGVVNLPNTTSGYYALFTDGNRNVDITNLNLPGSQALTLYVSLAPPQLPNRSPVFSDVAVAIICANDTTFLLNNAVDADGDRLVYSFGQPYGTTSGTGSLPLGSFTPPPPLLLYVPGLGYSPNTPFGTAAGNFASLNPSTGVAQYGATTVGGKYAVAVDIKEYRTVNGQEVLVGTTRRDLQLVVALCPATKAPALAPALTMPRSYTVEAGSTLSIPISATQADGHPLTMTLNSVLLDGAGGYNAALDGDPGTVAAGNPTGTAQITGTGGTVAGTLVYTAACGEVRATPYDVAVIVKDNGCAGKTVFDVLRITVVQPPAPVVTGNLTICRGTSTTLAVAGSTTYTITGGPATLTGAGPFVLSPTQTTTYTITGTNAAGCIATTQATVAVLPLPLAGVGVAARSTCSGVPITLGTTAVGGNTYSWSPSTGLSSATVANPTLTLTNPTGAPITQTYTLTETTAIGGCTATNAVAVTVTPLPVAVPGAALAICAGGMGQLGAAPVAGLTYSWSPATGLSNPSIANPVITLANTTSAASSQTYTLTVTNPSTTCTSSGTVVVTVNPMVAGGTIGTDQTVCAGATPAALTSTAAASGGIGPYAYQWEASADNATWAAIAGATGATYAPGVGTATTYFRRRATASACGTALSNVVTLTVQPLVTPAVALATPAAQCAGTAFAFSPVPTNAGTAPTYRWFVNNALVATSATYSSTTLANGDQVRVELTPTAGFCATGGATATVTISLTPVALPVLTISAQTALPACAGTPVTFRVDNVSNLGASPQYQWQVDGVAVGAATAGANTFTSSTLRDGQVVTLSLRTTTVCGPVTVVSNAVRAAISPTPDVEAGPNKVITEGEQVTLDGTAQGNYALTWTPIATLSFLGGNQLRPTAAPLVTTTYLLTGTLGDCSDTSSVTVTVTPRVRIPSALSPNGDGLDDTWEIDNIGAYPTSHVLVFNRWGSKIFETNGYSRSNEWNGTISGQPAPVGTYYYVITLGNGKSYSGPLTVVY